MSGTWTPGMGTMDTLPPADGLPDWLRRMGWSDAAELLEVGTVPGSPAAALELALRELWKAHCQGVDLRSLRALGRTVWVLCSGGAK